MKLNWLVATVVALSAFQVMANPNREPQTTICETSPALGASQIKIEGRFAWLKLGDGKREGWTLIGSPDERTFVYFLTELVDPYSITKSLVLSFSEDKKSLGVLYGRNEFFLGTECVVKEDRVVCPGRESRIEYSKTKIRATGFSKPQELGERTYQLPNPLESLDKLNSHKSFFGFNLLESIGGSMTAIFVWNISPDDQALLLGVEGHNYHFSTCHEAK